MSNDAKEMLAEQEGIPTPRRRLAGMLLPAWRNYHPWKSAVQIIEDIPYAGTSHPKQALDLILP